MALLCRSRANPPVSNYTWYKDEQQEVGEAGQSLLLASVEPSHAGQYRCSAGNQLGETVSPPTQLDVQCESVFFPGTQRRHSRNNDDTQTCVLCGATVHPAALAHSDVDPGQVWFWLFCCLELRQSRNCHDASPPGSHQLCLSSAACSAMFRCFVWRESDVARSQTSGFLLKSFIWC